MTILEAIGVIALTAVGSAVQGSVGIGLSLVAAPGLIAIDADFAPGPLMAGGVAVSFRHFITERRHALASDLRALITGLPFGLAAGIAFIIVADARLLSIVIGVTIVVFAVVLLGGAHIKRTQWSLRIVGAATAFTSSTAALPGPPLALTFSDVEGPRLRGTLGTCVCALGTLLFIALTLAGKYGVDELKLTAIMIPGVSLGLGLSKWARPYLDRSWLRPAILLLSAAGGLTLILRNI